MRIKIISSTIVIVLLSLVAYQKYSEYSAIKSVDSYDSCVTTKGSVIQESYPATCITRLGSRFIQNTPSPSQSTSNSGSSTPIPTLTPKPSESNGKCKISGCSGEMCVSEVVSGRATICLYQNKFSCYKNAQCEKQSNGECGWTQTVELEKCLKFTN